MILPLAMLAAAQAAEPSLAYALVRSLTTEVGPRLAGTANDARARRWALGRLAALGFVDVREEPFTTDGWVRGEERAAMVAPTVQPILVTAFGRSVATPAGGLTAPLAYFKDLAALQAAPDAAVSRRIVFVDAPTPERSPLGLGASALAEDRNPTIALAARKGAAAVLLRSAATGTGRFAHTGVMRYQPGVPEIPAAALALPDADQLARATALGPVTLRLELTPRRLGPVRSANVIAEIRGRKRPQEIVLIGAHLDSWDLGTGAIDDGAGVAIAIAAAQRLLAGGGPDRTLRVVLFGAEETSLDGARAYARVHQAELSRHVIATEADFGAARPFAFYTGVPDALLPRMDQVAAALAPLGIARGHNHASGGEDLYFLKKAGVPVASIVQDGSHYFDIHHSADDTLDKIDPAALETNVEAYARFLKALCSL